MRILAITEDSALREKLKKCLSDDYSLDFFDTGEDGVYASQTESYDLVLVHASLSDLRASVICRQIRQKDVEAPLLTLVPSRNPIQHVACLKQGADDSLTIPFSAEELAARVKALLRRASPGIPLENIYRLGNLEVNFWEKTLNLKDKRVHMRKREFDLLEYLIKNRNRVVSRARIWNAVWPENATSISNVVDVSVCTLRRKLKSLTGVDPIRTVYGSGYEFDESKLQK